MRRTKAYLLLSIIAVVTVSSLLTFSVLASEDAANEKEETTPPFLPGFCNRWLDLLNDEQLAQLEQLLEENRAQVQNQLETWGVEISELSEQQREELKAIIEENRAEVKELLESWGIETPIRIGPKDWLVNLTDEQKEELQAMRRDYLDAVKAKLEEWGVETPEINGEPLGDMGFPGGPLGGMRCWGRGLRGFGLFKP